MVASFHRGVQEWSMFHKRGNFETVVRHFSHNNAIKSEYIKASILMRYSLTVELGRFMNRIIPFTQV